MISILLHLYYPESIKTVLPQITKDFLGEDRLYVNLVNSAPFDEKAFEVYDNVTILKSSNVGKDIGGKLVLIDSLMQLKDESKYWIFLHDKHSPHTTTGKFWRDSLFSIVDVRNKELILDYMERIDTNVLTHKNFIMNEWRESSQRFQTINHDKLVELTTKYDVRPRTYEFAAGTMFWAKSEALKRFFSKNHPLDIRATLEKGNVLDHHQGTNAHSWERLLSWIALDNTKRIAGIG
ncbi:rhamnan synthesis F family protein [Pontibacter sp. 13R65]|uniref:rhamnan synthesis F family protein n=1 Tax=Pontibacter sp. 13R65 TaxID=3127458 RepID=UPI00301CAB03